MRMSAMTGMTAALAMASALATGARAACPDDTAVARLAADLLTKTPAQALEVETMEDALCAQDKLVRALAAEFGPPVGHKAGLTSEPAQRMFGVSEPVRGRLFGRAMLESGASVPALHGAVPRFEADLVVVVAGEGLNEAETPLEALGHLSAVHPFIELPDLVVADPRGLDGPTLTAINVGARMGVLGEPVPVEASQAFLDALADMTVVVMAQDGETLSSAPGAAILGQPIEAVLWLRRAGVVFEAGDLVSLGSFGPLMEPKPGLTATVTYEGLAGSPSVSVTFE
ncbi:2-keto-4-pentenoate hydratase [Lutibaculum baratangense]|uniref:Hydratase/decarboxylase n=1 Tax=Lutibaculum baratangense AMV1 TaxID=631454 RepID=V4RH93_9HYPH|nr:Hydratase/decarboxylase [Lutibaculum baratangense]ESR25491.1 Hydratase/decarboxylase [Lutibaculum baratangense AMV1]